MKQCVVQHVGRRSSRRGRCDGWFLALVSSLSNL